MPEGGYLILGSGLLVHMFLGGSKREEMIDRWPDCPERRRPMPWRFGGRLHTSSGWFRCAKARDAGGSIKHDDGGAASPSPAAEPDPARHYLTTIRPSKPVSLPSQPDPGPVAVFNVVSFPSSIVLASITAVTLTSARSHPFPHPAV